MTYLSAVDLAFFVLICYFHLHTQRYFHVWHFIYIVLATQAC